MPDAQPASLSRQRTAAGLVLHATVFALAGAYFAALFLRIPIGTEARDYIFHDGFLSLDSEDLRIAVTHLSYPLGQNSRLVSMAIFAASHGACGLNNVCLNAIQIGLLLAAYAAGAWHLQQLIRRAFPTALAMACWAISAPVFSAGYWQATQHDKLAFIFALSALAIGLRALRRGRAKFRAMTSLALLSLFVLAVNAKEMAFFLPVSAIAQILLLAPGATMRQKLRAGAMYAAPLAYASFYIGVYLAKLHGPWKDHVLAGNLPKALAFYAGSLAGIHPAPGAAIALGGAFAAASVTIALQLRRTRPQSDYARASLYLLIIAMASTASAARAQNPSDYYMLVPQWALLGWIALTATAALEAGLSAKYAALAIAAALAIECGAARYADYTAPWGSFRQLRDAYKIQQGYAVIQRNCGAGFAGGLKLAFATHPAGEWWYFRGINDRPDQLVGAFICQDGQVPVMDYSFDGNAHPDRAGQTVATWSTSLAVTVVAQQSHASATLTPQSP